MTEASARGRTTALGDRRAALVGAGLVGASWAVVFARAGWSVRLFDAASAQLECAPARIRASLDDLHARGLLAEPVDVVAGRIALAPGLAAAVDGAEHVQESVSEKLDVKRAVFRELDALAPPHAVLASSTSAFAASGFAAGLPGAARCLVAHPVNPPHLVPLVEVCGAPFTDAGVVERTRALMASLGQAPIVLRREVHGFVLNRLQWSLLAEGYRLYAAGVASADEIDVAMRHGLGRRWSFIGPFEVGDLNAPDGLRDYLERFGATIERIDREARANPLVLEPDVVARLHAERRALLPDAERPARMAWRDERLAALAQHLAEQAAADGAAGGPPAGGSRES